MYNGTFEEGDDDEESYEGNEEDEEESGEFIEKFYSKFWLIDTDEEDDLSDADVSADPVEGNSPHSPFSHSTLLSFIPEKPKGEKRKRSDENPADEDDPPKKI